MTGSCRLLPHVSYLFWYGDVFRFTFWKICFNVGISIMSNFHLIRMWCGVIARPLALSAQLLTNCSSIFEMSCYKKSLDLETYTTMANKPLADMCDCITHIVCLLNDLKWLPPPNLSLRFVCWYAFCKIFADLGTARRRVKTLPQQFVFAIDSLLTRDDITRPTRPWNTSEFICLWTYKN